MEEAEPVPLHRPYLTGQEGKYVSEALEARHHHGDGPFTERCHERLRGLTGVEHALLTTSCSSALEMAAILARRVEPGQFAGEVVVPSFTFVTSANAFVGQGYRPVFAEVREDTGNLDEGRVEEFITSETRAIVAVHYAGVPAEMDRLRAVADQHDLALVEDAAHALGARYRGRPVGSLADLGTFSFHGTKNITCGEGGCLTVADPERAKRAEIVREKGTNRRQFIEGRVDKYNWVDLGGSYLPADLLAAVLLAQLEEIETIQASRAERHRRYMAGLRELEERGVLRLPAIPEHVTSAHHLFYVRLEDVATRERLGRALKAQRIGSAFHYPALHLSPMGRRLGGVPGSLPVAERVSACLLRLPFYPDLALSDLDRVVEAVRAFFSP
ncbi:MAG: dTDP-4-amino-4,6-dideoxygalactose transaminase [Myxococcota bacterium]